MFDIGFSEMMVIAVVALLVLGPERLPKVARTIGHLLGRAQRYVNDVKADINREMELSELSKMRQEFESAARNVEQSVQTDLHRIESDLNAAAQGASGEAASGADAASPSAAPPAPSAAPLPAPQLAATRESAADVMARLAANDRSAIAPDRR